MSLQACLRQLFTAKPPDNHNGVASLELEQAVIRAAQQHHIQPALLLAVMKAKSSFNSIVISKAKAGLNMTGAVCWG
jgi:soluble lytic murein transglycosylase-like protein